MGNFRHQSLRNTERERDRESERERQRDERDREGQERLRNVRDKYAVFDVHIENARHNTAFRQV